MNPTTMAVDIHSAYFDAEGMVILAEVMRNKGTEIRFIFDTETSATRREDPFFWQDYMSWLDQVQRVSILIKADQTMPDEPFSIRKVRSEAKWDNRSKAVISTVSFIDVYTYGTKKPIRLYKGKEYHEGYQMGSEESRLQ